MMPDPSMGLTTQRPEISVLRADTPIMAFKPYTDDEEQKIGNELSKQLDIKAGGVAGIASTTSRAVIALEKTCFRPGESININIDIDNSACKKAVKSFKTKLIRKVKFFSGKDAGPGNNQIIESETYVHVIKHPGVPAGVHERTTVTLDVPLKDTDPGST